MPIRIGGYKDFPEHAKTPVPRLGGNRAPYSYSVVLWPLLGVALTGGITGPIPLQRSNHKPLAKFLCEANRLLLGQSLAAYIL